jgi:hypothetical protein
MVPAGRSRGSSDWCENGAHVCGMLVLAWSSQPGMCWYVTYRHATVGHDRQHATVACAALLAGTGHPPVTVQLQRLRLNLPPQLLIIALVLLAHRLLAFGPQLGGSVHGACL